MVPSLLSYRVVSVSDSVTIVRCIQGCVNDFPGYVAYFGVFSVLCFAAYAEKKSSGISWLQNGG